MVQPLDHGIISWVTINRYPIQSHLYYYILIFMLSMFSAGLFYAWRRRGIGSKTTPKADTQTYILESKDSSYKLFFFVIAPILIYLAVYNGGLNRPVDFYHEGECLASCQELLDGKVPYRDFYCMHGVLHNVFLPFLGLKLFGMSLEGFRRFYSIGQHGLVAPLGYISLYILALVLYRRRLTAFLSFVFLLCTIGSDVISGRQMFAALALAPAISFVDSPKLWKLFLSGVFTAISVMYSSEFGIPTFIVIFLWLLFRSFIADKSTRSFLTNGTRYIGGFCLGIAPFAAYLFFNAALMPYLRSILEAARLHPLIFGSPFIMDHETKYLPVAIYIAGVIWMTKAVIYRNITGISLKSALLIGAGILYFYPALIRPDSTHIRYSTFPAYMLLMIPAEGLVLNKRRNIAAIFLAVIIAAWLFGIFSPKDALEEMAKRAVSAFSVPSGYAKVDSPRMGNVLIPEKQAREIQEVLDFIKGSTRPGDYIYDFSNRGLYYFLADRRIPTRYAFLIYASSSDGQREVVRDLIKYKPRYVIGGYETECDGIKNGVRFPIVWEHIRSHYKPISKAGDLEISELTPLK